MFKIVESLLSCLYILKMMVEEIIISILMSIAIIILFILIVWLCKKFNKEIGWHD